MSTIDEILAPYIVRSTEEGAVDWVRLKLDLLAREDNVADVLRLGGVQFGLFPEIVSEVLAEAGLGTPPTAEVRDMIRRQFRDLMDRLRREYEAGGDHNH